MNGKWTNAVGLARTGIYGGRTPCPSRNANLFCGNHFGCPNSKPKTIKSLFSTWWWFRIELLAFELVCCSGDVSLISLRHLPNSIQNSSISGVQSWIISSSPGRSVFLPFFAFQITLSDIFPLETVTNSNRRHSLQLFVVEFDTCLVWGLLLLPSNANYAYVKGVRWRHLQGPNSTVWMPSIVSQINCCVDKPRFHNSLKERGVSSSSIHPSIEREREAVTAS